MTTAVTAVALALGITTSASTVPATRVASAQLTHEETIHTTTNHPWLTADPGWVLVGDLKPGERVVTLDGHTTSVVAWVHVVPGQADMYSLTVANDHV